MNYSNRKALRLDGYDYSQHGAYFITICTKDRQALLSDIRRGGALLRPIGEIVESEIQCLMERYPIHIEKYVIMPDHVHLIVFILRAEQSPAPTISDVICSFKSITTKGANKLDQVVGRQIWQRSYYDHVIRSEQDYQEIWRYIDANPHKWEETHGPT